MKTRGAPLLLAALIWLEQPAPAAAGMPSLTLTDIARMRIQTISFFLACLLLSAFAVRAIWNSLRTDFPRMPRLSYGKALGIVTLWGLLFLLVLTMISGARELMTPGAWKKDGLTYTLATTPSPPAVPAPEGPQSAARQVKLERLRDALRRYADAHNGALPATRSTGDIPDELWRVPDASNMHYIYVGGRFRDHGFALIAYEPNIFGADVKVLLANGEVRTMSSPDLRRALDADAGRPG